MRCATPEGYRQAPVDDEFEARAGHRALWDGGMPWSPFVAAAFTMNEVWRLAANRWQLMVDCWCLIADSSVAVDGELLVFAYQLTFAVVQPPTVAHQVLGGVQPDYGELSEGPKGSLVVGSHSVQWESTMVGGSNTS